MKLWDLGLVCLALVSATSCGGDAQAPEPCLGPADVTVGPGLTPEFIWSPDCAVAGLTVNVSNRTFDQVWAIFVTDEANRLRAGVHYGTVPAGAHQQGDLVPLTAGTTYLVRLVVVAPGSGGEPVYQGAGGIEFTP